MLRVVLPLVALAGLTAVDVLVVVPIEIIVVVDVHVAVVPIAIAPIAPIAAPSAPGGGAQRNSGAPHQSCTWHIAGIRIRVIRIISRSSSVNDRRVVRGDVSYVGAGLLNLNYLLTAFDGFCLHRLLRAGF